MTGKSTGTRLIMLNSKKLKKNYPLWLSKQFSETITKRVPVYLPTLNYYLYTGIMGKSQNLIII